MWIWMQTSDFFNLLSGEHHNKLVPEINCRVLEMGSVKVNDHFKQATSNYVKMNNLIF